MADRFASRRGAAETYDGRAADTLVRLLDLPRVEVYDSVTSTQDVAHALAESGAPAGTLVLAEQQTAGRGRGGRAWTSAPGAGIWLTLLERPRDAAAMETLAIRVGLRAAKVLDRYTSTPVRLKWPNDLLLGDAKLGGILVEARWNEARPEWAAIGLGVNLEKPIGLPGATLRSGSNRVAILGELVPALRAAAAAKGALSTKELAEFSARDAMRGRRVREPAAGTVEGIDARGGLLIATAAGTTAYRSGSLVLEEGTA